MSDAATRDEHWDRAGAAIAAVVRDGTAAFATIGDPNLYSTFAYIAHTVRELVPDVVGRDRARASPRCRTWPRARGRCSPRARERLALIPYTAGDDALREALASFDTVVVYKGGRQLPAVLRAIDDAGGRAVYGEELGRPGETLTPPDGAAPYMSTVIVPAARDGRGSRL